MSVLRNLEAKLGGIVEGAFGRAFKTSVQPVELAHKLAKEMEENQMVSVSRVYVPNHYRVFLSPSDREQFASYEPALRKELSDYLLEHARQERLRAHQPAAGRVPHRRPARARASSASRRSCSAGRRRRASRPRRGRRPGDFGHTMVYSPDREARPLEPALGSPPGAARGRGPAQRAERRPRDGRPQPRVRRGRVRPERVAAATSSCAAANAAGPRSTSGRPTA